MRFYKKVFLSIAVTVSLAACKKWDDHIEVGNQDLNSDLYTAISSNPQLSKFKEYVLQTGLDTLLRSTRTYTVWAPDNTALQALDPAVVADKAQLRLFLQNHIANQSYFTRDAQAQIRVPMLNGKYNNFLGTAFGDATITTKDKFVKNGVLHIINKNIVVLPSLWDFVNSTTAQYVQNAFIAGLNFTDFDPATAIIDSISSITGLPVYHAGTGLVNKNRFNDRVYNLKNESKEYTYFVLNNTAFALESDSLKPYFATGVPFTNDSLAKWNTVKDLMIEGIVSSSAFLNLMSKFGVPIPANPINLVETKKFSNGVAYVFSKLDVVSASKLKTGIIQGETPSGFLSDKSGNTNYRVRYNPATGLDFVDILVSGHAVTSYYAYYRINEVPSVKYKVYISAANDFQTGAFAQNIVFKTVVPGQPSTAFPSIANLLHNVPLYTAVGAYNELYLGDVIVPNYGSLEIQLTASATNPIVMDYLRLVPAP
jgi:uncharacterized surface protein with fasciclin (FAS1) repeats